MPLAVAVRRRLGYSETRLGSPTAALLRCDDTARAIPGACSEPIDPSETSDSGLGYDGFARNAHNLSVAHRADVAHPIHVAVYLGFERRIGRLIVTVRRELFIGKVQIEVVEVVHLLSHVLRHVPCLLEFGLELVVPCARLLQLGRALSI